MTARLMLPRRPAWLRALWAGAGLMDYLVDRKRVLMVSLPEISSEHHTPQPQ